MSTTRRLSRARLRVPLLVVLLAAITTTMLSGVARAQSTLAQSPQQDQPADAGPLIEILPVEGYLDPPAVSAIREVIRAANQRESHLVIIQLDSPAGMSADVEGLLETIRSSEVPVAVFVGPRRIEARAGGAAGLALVAAHVGAMSSDATVGPTVPADLAGSERPGLQADAPEAIRDQAVAAERAEELGLADVLAAGLEPLLVELDGRSVTTGSGETVTLRIRRDEITTRLHSLGLVGRLAHAAAHPVVMYLALAAGLAMLLFEVFQPGFGVAGVAGLITVGVGVYGLTVLPVMWWALALLVLGLVLYAVDAAVAGFGPVTLTATASFVAGSWWLFEPAALALAWPVVTATTGAALIFFVVVLTVVLRAQAPPEEAAIEDLVGRVGMVRSTLNPEGHVYIDEALWRARWTGEGDRVSVGTPIRVHDVDGAVVLVEAFDPDTAGAGTDTGPGADQAQ